MNYNWGDPKKNSKLTAIMMCVASQRIIVVFSCALSRSRLP